MAVHALVKRIKEHRRLANKLHRMARRRHLRAAALAKQALAAKQDGHDIKARNLMQRALRLKAMATRTGMRSKMHRAQMAKLKERVQRQRADHG